MRLIEVDALKESFGDQRLDGDWGIYGDETTARDLIDEAPIIDAEPVRHGKWVDDNSGNHDSRDTWFMCLCCGYHTTSRWIADYKYCPHCGAKMDLND